MVDSLFYNADALFRGVFSQSDIAIVIGEMIIQLMFNGFVALGAPTTIQNVVTGVALLVIVALTTKPVKGLVVK